MPDTAIDTTPGFASLTATYLSDEADLLADLIATANLTGTERETIEHAATRLIERIRHHDNRPSLVDAFLSEFRLSTDEGVILMRLAESLIRTPDQATANMLVRDKLMAGDWGAHFGSGHLLVNAGSLGLVFSKAWVRATGGTGATHLLARLGDAVMVRAVRAAMAFLGRHFVLGDTIENAVRRARTESDYGATYSFDMLGEAAMTAKDAERYFADYRDALEVLGRVSVAKGLHDSPSLSVKLSALHPRYDFTTKERCVPMLAKKLVELCSLAKRFNLGLTIDAEEADRLEVSLLVFEQLLRTEALKDWAGLGLAVQAYQRRALAVIDWLNDAATRHDRTITVRLVKGAYWDSEIKRAQEMGLSSYPVFTRKENTDVSYLGCARKLLNAGPRIYPQFATHNAQSAAAILHMAGASRDFEFQRLHGMSHALHRQLAEAHGLRSRTYAPVGRHKELLPYLVRRLLENGANSSFVNLLMDEDTGAQELSRDPISAVQENTSKQHPAIPEPRDLFSGRRLLAKGHDFTQSDCFVRFDGNANTHRIEASDLIGGEARARPNQAIYSPQNTQETIGSWTNSDADAVIAAIALSKKSDWKNSSSQDRSAILRNAANALERNSEWFMSLCVLEAGKTWTDADAEVREAIDFLRYYANEAERGAADLVNPLGTVACISPWNFPLAIFLGQVSAALSVGNCVIAKPAEQTPLVAYEAIKLLHQAGIPAEALHLVLGDGSVGAQLVSHTDIDGVCFTGSTITAKRIHQSLAQTNRAAIPFIAETGGINVMIVDSTALLEQAVQDVIDSAFQSAGQRCSACRIVCVQEDIAQPFIDMLEGAMAEISIGDPANLNTDIGPVIDETAKAMIETYIAEMRQRFEVIDGRQTDLPDTGHFVRPTAIKVDCISDVTREVFGPVVHVLSFAAAQLDQILNDINALGYGLTMGLHTRIDARMDLVSNRARVGNLYINRNQIGAVVGVQPFGGDRLSGTGPKAGGPYYLARFTKLKSAAFAGSDNLQRHVTLPGPTGELNRLTLHPRGRILCLGGDTPDILPAQVEAVRATGNTPVTAELPDAEDITSFLGDDIDAVIADGSIHGRVAANLASRDGHILTLLSSSDPLWRFYTERVVTTDMTAAGGNASLLASI